jgi:DNA-binding MarR family transcriptional regulator
MEGAMRGREIGEQCVMFNVRKAARGLSRRYEEALRPLGLKAGQFSILAALLDAGDAALGTVSQRLGMDRTTLNRNLRPLERRGLVASHPDPEDGRTRRIALTAEGRQVMDRAIPLWRQAQADSLARLGHDRWPDFKTDLNAVS